MTISLISYLTSVASGTWWAVKGDTVHVAIRLDIPRMQKGYCVTMGPNAYSVPLIIGASKTEIQEIAKKMQAK